MPYQIEMTREFHPRRRKVDFFNSKEASIRDLIMKLNFIKNKKQWGYPFRRGLFEIAYDDFLCIAEAMEAVIPDRAYRGRSQIFR